MPPATPQAEAGARSAAARWQSGDRTDAVMIALVAEMLAGRSVDHLMSALASVVAPVDRRTAAVLSHLVSAVRGENVPSVGPYAVPEVGALSADILSLAVGFRDLGACHPPDSVIRLSAAAIERRLTETTHAVGRLVWA